MSAPGPKNPFVSDPDVRQGAQALKRRGIRTVVNIVSYGLCFLEAFVIVVFIHWGIVFFHWMRWKTASWVDWVESQEIGLFILLAIIFSLALYFIGGRGLLKSTKDETENTSETVPREEQKQHGSA